MLCSSVVVVWRQDGDDKRATENEAVSHVAALHFRIDACLILSDVFLSTIN